MNFYVTFGQQYRYEQHPSGIHVHPDAVIKIEAENRKAAHKKAMKIFKKTFHHVLNEQEWEANFWYFPKGVIEITQEES